MGRLWRKQAANAIRALGAPKQCPQSRYIFGSIVSFAAFGQEHFTTTVGGRDPTGLFWIMFKGSTGSKLRRFSRCMIGSSVAKVAEKRHDKYERTLYLHLHSSQKNWWCLVPAVGEINLWRNELFSRAIRTMWKKALPPSALLSEELVVPCTRCATAKSTEKWILLRNITMTASTHKTST